MSIWSKKPKVEVRTVSVVIPQHMLRDLLQIPGSNDGLITLKMSSEDAMMDVYITSYDAPNNGLFVEQSTINYRA